MKISARNQLKGTIANVQEGAVNGVVTIDLGENAIKADITMESIKELGLEAGKEAFAIIKATNVMFATSKIVGISARNQLAGTVKSVQGGAVNGIVTIELAGGQIVTAAVTMGSIERLGLEEGVECVAIIKASDVIVAVD